MPDAITPNYSFTLPTVGADPDTWGTTLNGNWTSCDTQLLNVNNRFANYLPLWGGTLTGGLAVGGSGINFTNYYGGNSIAFGWDGSWLQTFVNNSYIGAMATTNYVGNVAASYLPLGGGTITGSLNVNGNTWCGNTVTANQLTSNANINAAGAIAANGNINAAGGIYADGDIEANGNIYTTGGSVQAAAGMSPQTNWDSAFSLFANSNGNYFQFTGDYYIQLGPAAHINFVNAGATICWMNPNGDLHVAGNVYAANVSDARVKKNITPFRRGLAEIIKLKSISWQFNGQGGTDDDGRVHYGWTAQDVQPFIPEAVYIVPELKQAADYNPPDGASATHPSIASRPVRRLPDQLGLDRDAIMLALVNAVQELSAIATAQAVRLAALEAH